MLYSALPSSTLLESDLLFSTLPDNDFFYICKNTIHPGGPTGHFKIKILQYSPILFNFTMLFDFFFLEFLEKISKKIFSRSIDMTEAVFIHNEQMQSRD